MRPGKTLNAPAAKAVSTSVSIPEAGPGKERPIAAQAQTQSPPSRHASKRPASRKQKQQLPSLLRFPLVVILSLSMSALARSVLLDGSYDSRRALASITRKPEPWPEMAVLVGWRIIELALGWFGNYDGFDLAALSLLSHGPYHFLLESFYQIPAMTVLLSLSIDVCASFVPFVLLRPLSRAHSDSPDVFNREVVTDRIIQGATAFLAGVVYHTSVLLAFRTYLPDVLVLYFNGIPSVEVATATDVGAATSMLFANWTTVALSLMFGIAARTFVFTPYATTPTDDDAIEPFDPVRATLGATVWWNLWGYQAQTKVAITRTAALMAVAGVTTYLQCAMTIKGVEPRGAAAYAALWVVADLVAGLAMKWVGGA